MLAKVAGSVSPTSLDNTAALQALLERQPVLLDQFSGGVTAYRLEGTARRLPSFLAQPNGSVSITWTLIR